MHVNCHVMSEESVGKAIAASPNYLYTILKFLFSPLILVKPWAMT